MSDSMRDALVKAGFSSKQSGQDSKPKQNPANPSANTSEDYTLKAEKVILELKNQKGYDKFTTSKIRNILSLVTGIYNDVLTDQSDTLSSDIYDRIMHMKVRLIYECGRENIIKMFYEKAGLEKMINDIQYDRKKFIAFARYMEALVAYHRFYGGRD